MSDFCGIILACSFFLFSIAAAEFLIILVNSFSSGGTLAVRNISRSFTDFFLYSVAATSFFSLSVNLCDSGSISDGFSILFISARRLILNSIIFFLNCLNCLEANVF